MKATVTWWSHEDEVGVRDVIELDRVIDDVIESECKEYPTVLEIHANSYLFTIAVGLAESFVQMTSESLLSSHLVAVSNKNAADDDTFTFFFQGMHDTEVRRRYILPSTVARELARSFVVTGSIPKDVEWEEV
jgi:hypothetical protein